MLISVMQQKTQIDCTQYCLCAIGYFLLSSKYISRGIRWQCNNTVFQQEGEKQKPLE